MTVTAGDEIKAVAKRLNEVAYLLNHGGTVPATEYTGAVAALRAWRDSDGDSAPRERPEINQ